MPRRKRIDILTILELTEMDMVRGLGDVTDHRLVRDDVLPGVDSGNNMPVLGCEPVVRRNVDVHLGRGANDSCSAGAHCVHGCAVWRADVDPEVVAERACATHEVAERGPAAEDRARVAEVPPDRVRAIEGFDRPAVAAGRAAGACLVCGASGRETDAGDECKKDESVRAAAAAPRMWDM